MTWPITFAGLPSPQQLSDFDVMFQQVAAISSIPSTATGANAISLLPVINCPTLAAYTELCGFRFRAAGNSTGLVTLQFSGLGFLPVYLADGVTQANIGSVLAGVEYVAHFSQSLNSGSGGFFLEAPAVPVASQATSFSPGGRLTIQASVPIMNASQANQTTLYYAPYVHPFCPVYNGSIILMQQFTSGLSDTVGLSFPMAGSANWPANTVFDVFLTLNGGLPVLVTVPWANPAARATLLAIFGGFLTNATLATARLGGAGGTISLLINQGTYLGTFSTSASTGTTNFIFGGSASGGSAGVFNVYNYYNKALFLTKVTDSGASYSYNSATVRQARASGNNQISWVSGAAETASLFTYSANSITQPALQALANTGIGFGSTTTFSALSAVADPVGTASLNTTITSTLSVQTLGSVFVAALEASDGTNFNIFDNASNNGLTGMLWL